MLRCSFPLSGLFALLVGCTFPVAAGAQARVSATYGQLPLHFEANRGQTDEDVRFLSRGSGYSLYLTNREAVLVLSRANADAQRDARSTQRPSDPQARDVQPVALRMSLVGAAHNPLVSGIDELPSNANYFTGKDPSQWRTNVPTYAKVHYREVYPGIDLLYYGNQRQLEYDFVVAPGADPKKIVLGFKGADRLEIDAQGELVLHTAGGDIRQHKPIIYQEINGVRQAIEGGYIRKGAKRVGFQVAAYDRSRPLVIDPILAYSTYLGGSWEDSNPDYAGNGDDYGSGIAVDAAGNAYITGYTGSHHFPTTAGALQPTFGGGQYNAFVTKLDPTGALVYSTYLGGSGTYGGGIAVDATGNAYVTGQTFSADFPTTPGAFQPAGVGGGGFVTKLDPTGSALVYSTYVGGTYPPGVYSGDAVAGIAVDASGNAYVTGSTYSASFPTTAGAFQPSFGGRRDAFVTKLNPAGSALVYSTYLGGGDGESGRGIALDTDGNVYVTGATNSTNFPTTAGAFQPGINQGLCQTGYNGRVQCSDVFVTKLDATGSALIYSTYLGDTLSESSSGIAVDVSGNAYVTGVTDSTSFPTTAGAFQPRIYDTSTCFDPYTGGYVPCAYHDAFVTKLDPTGSALVYSTYLGGNNSYVGGIAVDAAGSAYVTGSAWSPDFPTTPGTLSTLRGAGAFLTKLDPGGSALVYSTYPGGSAIAVDAAGSAYVTGSTVSFDFPTTAGAFQTRHGERRGSSDAFVAKIVHARSEETAASYTAWWGTYGSETGTFSGGTVTASDCAEATNVFSFTGTAVSWIGVRCVICGIATVSIDGGAPTTVDTAGPGTGYLTSEPVFFASGLAPDVSHTMVITVTGTTTSDGAYIAVDAFDVMR